ncbi:MAG: phosphomannomutase/phosphoglucomutase [Phycisphaeraceae bacterium]|nr:phosphomannomutase/phosphoglucomutase [Phycisphaeraceae bacterium]
MLGRVFKAYDVRGTYPDLLNDQMAWQIGFGVSRFLRGEAEAAGQTNPMMRNVVVGRDMRVSSPSLARSLVSGINAQGGDVIDVGLVDTPFVTFAINHLGCAGGVMVTASHNPPQYNGFKVSRRQGKPVGEMNGLAEVRKYAAMVDTTIGRGAGGRSETRDLWEAYSRHVLRTLDLKRPLKIVIDASNGMAGAMVPRVFGKGGANIKGLTIVDVNFEHTKGNFAHEPNPLVAANLAQTQEAVKANKADLGVCFDGDADRLVVVDEKGAIIGCDHLTALLAKWFLARSPGAGIVYDLRSTKAVEEDVRAAGGTPYRCRVGHVFMKQVMAEHNCVFGGELSGHFYFRDNFYADSGAIALTTLLTVVSGQSKPLSVLIAPVRRYVQSGEINFVNEEADAALGALREQFVDEADVDELDGVTIDLFKARGWWCNVRKSNTEPLLRLNVEAKDKKVLDKVLAELRPRLGRRVDH